MPAIAKKRRVRRYLATRPGARAIAFKGGFYVPPYGLSNAN